MKRVNRDKEAYKELRASRLEELWARADAGATSPGLIRAIGAKAGDSEKARRWLTDLLSNEDEKVRRYAVNGSTLVKAAEAEIARGLMRALPFDLSHTSRPIGVTTRKDWLPTAAQQAFLELLPTWSERPAGRPL